MAQNSLWIIGSTRTGKTTRLVSQFYQWVEGGLDWSNPKSSSRYQRTPSKAPGILVFAANDDNRRQFADRLTEVIRGRYPVLSKTPLGFFQDEVMLFWPLLIGRLDIKAQFPLRLRPETEQDLATQHWRTDLDNDLLQLPGGNDYTRVRRLLDLLQLAAVSGIPVEDIPHMLTVGIPEEEGNPELWSTVGKLLLEWRSWCLERGFLSYGIIAELYWRYLLPDPTYQQYLQQRYQAVLADDVDDYPAIARDLFETLLNQGAVGAFSFNPNGQVRLGLNADPNYLADLASRCLVEILPDSSIDAMPVELANTVVELITNSMFIEGLPESIQSIQTTSRAQLLQQTAGVISQAVKSGQVQPGEIAIIAPGLDAIARYTLTEILTNQGIAVEPLNDQRPLISSPMVQGLLTLLALVYPGLGRLVNRDAIAQMLVVLSSQPQVQELKGERLNVERLKVERLKVERLKVERLKVESSNLQPATLIDPVRAGLLADHCYAPDPEQPRLLPVESFPRWDRLGHQATTAYSEIFQWLELQREQQQQGLIPSCLVVFDRAIQKFLWHGSNLAYDQLAALRELMETAQHYWEVNGRLGKELKVNDSSQTNQQPSNRQRSTQTIAQFILMLRRGTVTANPYPVRRLPTATNAVTLATIFQYRAARRCHRWHFWLDAGSSLWLSGGAATLFGAHLFLKEWSGRPWTEEDKVQADQQRLERILRDLFGRVTERVYLCHSELAVSGTEQNGPLLSLIHTAINTAVS
ncbi:hypothetical protein [Moorena bouillonii]|uniref:Recombinase family protein n=1 Tax=Moorena bouillonii PNG TaxID=568701 RepID=A0A1U7MX56_9CYAN|nr:hypothetical protein [Moorena bouillonii]OLT58286.1 hypothetical protein BJP37_03725 [Moorena bouillonii PNG]